jgi:hypothetical protein
LWDGTLADGDPLTFVKRCEDAIVALVDAGIMCSIASHNTFSETRAVLKERQLWDKFIFPRIDFATKSSLVEGIIESCQLRRHNTIVIDDKARVRSEIMNAIPCLLAAVPREIFLSAFIEWSATAIPADGQRRLAQYKSLERNATAYRASLSSGASRSPG